MARRRNAKTGITDWISDVTDVFRPGQRPMETRQVTQFRDTTRNVVQTGSAAADLYTGGVAGSLTRNVLDPRAERGGTGRFVRDAGVAVAGAVVGGVAGRAAVKGVQAGVRRFLPQRVTEVGLHTGSPFLRASDKPISGEIRYVPEMRDTGWGASPSFPVQRGVTYKWSGFESNLAARGGVGRELSPREMAYSLRSYGGGSPHTYVTRSPVGKIDPESIPSLKAGAGGVFNARTTSRQKIAETIVGYEKSEEVARAIARQRASLASERQGLSNTAGVISGSAGGAIGAWQNQRRGRR